MMNISPVSLSRNAAYQKTPAAAGSQSFQSVLASRRKSTESGMNVKTGQNSWPPLASNYKASVNLDGIVYNDALFAKEIQIYDGVTVKTDKKINWGSTGKHQLTQEEISNLKKQYDVTNLSAQDYYDLMADLTNLNVLSPEEVVFKYYIKCEEPYPGDRVTIFYCGDYSLLGGYRDQPLTNMIKLLLDGKRYLGWGKEYVKTNDFHEANDALFSQKPELFPKFAETYQESYDFNEKILSVFAQLIPESSPWKDAIGEVEKEVSSMEHGLDTDKNSAAAGRKDSVIPPKEELLNYMIETMIHGWEGDRGKILFDALQNASGTLSPQG